MRMMSRIVVVLLGLVVSLPLHAQDDRGWDARNPQLTRAELEEMLSRFEQTAAASSYSRGVRDQARREAELIRQRLEEGDVRVGDRVSVVVLGQPTLSDTFPVISGRVLRLPELGDLQLAGVLRSELQEHLTREIGRFVRDPIVQVRSLVRLEILGNVGRPGFYTVPSDLLLSDALMVAGGPAGSANLEKITIKRGDQVLWDGDRLRQAVIGGRTLDQLNVRAGDSVYVPEKKGFFARIAPLTGILGAVTSLVWMATRVL